MARLSEAAFKQDFVRHFPGDDSGNLKPRQTPGMLYSKAVPTPVPAPALLAWSEALAAELGFAAPDEKDLAILAGNALNASMYPYAACYAGHQFGNWAGQLGDGRAITLAEWPVGDKSWELQLKGAGPTAYSRRADGRAVLRSSVREYLMSEAMHYLGVPTTRALALVTTGEPVLRDMFYDGHPAYEPGAIVMRVAPCFLRFGNYEMLASRGENELLQQLVHWTIDRHYPHIQGEDRVLRWFEAVVQRTAHLMTEWMRVGFVHGVMNTDNMSILGLTIDYGPYSFVDDYDLYFTPNTTDLPGRRYAFGKQPAIAKWNLGCLANALVPLFGGTEALVKVLDGFDDAYWLSYYSMMARKLGFDEVGTDEVALIREMEKMLSAVHPDMTLFFRLLTDLPLDDEANWLQHLSASFYQPPTHEQNSMMLQVLRQYCGRRGQNKESETTVQAVMRRNNPYFVLRNYLLHQAIEELQAGKNDLFQNLQQAIKDPYNNSYPQFFQKRPDWAAQQAGCSMLSCSS